MSSQVKEISETEVTIDAIRDGSPLTYKELNELIHDVRNRGFKTINVGLFVPSSGSAGAYA